MKVSKTENPVCGIIMPISKSDDEHTVAHWEKVKDIISEAIGKAGCKAQPVWEGGAHDIIQAKILQNIYENKVVVCDLSTRNPNVMLEIGMRLTTKKPTLLIAEDDTALPFDTGIIHTEFYNPRLEYRTTQAFIEKLSGQIQEKLSAFEAGEYHPYLEAFEFETVEPSRVTVSSEERLTELVEKMDAIVSKAEKPSISAGDIDWQLAREVALRGLKIGRDQSTGRFDDEAIRLWNAARHGKTEIPQNILAEYAKSAIRVGDIVTHKKFGIGQVVGKDGEKLEVEFESVGNKRVLSQFVELAG